MIITIPFVSLFFHLIHSRRSFHCLCENTRKKFEALEQSYSDVGFLSKVNLNWHFPNDDINHFFFVRFLRAEKENDNFHIRNDFSSGQKQSPLFSIWFHFLLQLDDVWHPKIILTSAARAHWSKTEARFDFKKIETFNESFENGEKKRLWTWTRFGTKAKK